MDKQIKYDLDEDIIYINFNSLYDFINYLDNVQTSNAFDGMSLSSYTGSFEFTGTDSFEQARKLCLEGEYSQDYEKFDSARIALETKIAEKEKNRKIKNDILGFAPNVPAYLMGHPLNMFNMEKSNKDAPSVVRIFYSISASAFEDKHNLYMRGICTLALIKQIESMGYRVQLDLVECSRTKNQVMITSWTLKNPDDFIDYRASYFPLVNPSFLRRLHFRLIEVVPELTKSWNYGYGYPLKIPEARKYLGVKSTDIIINTPRELGLSNSKSDIKNYEAFCDSLNIQSILQEKEQDKVKDKELY